MVLNGRACTPQTHRQKHTNAKRRKASQERHQPPKPWQGDRDHDTGRRHPGPRRHPTPSLSFLRLDVIRRSVVADHLDWESSGRDRIATLHRVLFVFERVLVLVVGCGRRWGHRVQAEHGFDREVELSRGGEEWSAMVKSTASLTGLLTGRQQSANLAIGLMTCSVGPELA